MYPRHGRAGLAVACGSETLLVLALALCTVRICSCACPFFSAIFLVSMLQPLTVRVLQIEYALESVKRGLTVVAVKVLFVLLNMRVLTLDHSPANGFGVSSSQGDKCLAFAVERRAVQPLQIPETMPKIHQVRS